MPSPVSVEFLRTASRKSLEDLALIKLNHVSLLKKRLRETIDEMASEQADASLALLLIEQDRLRDPLQHAFEFETETHTLGMGSHPR